MIEHQTAVLVRHFELLNRRDESRDTLDRAEYLALRTLASAGPMDINTLAAALGVDPSTAGRQVAVMRNAGLAACSPDPADRRRSVVAPTDDGLDRMAAVRRLRTDSIADLLAGWTPEDLRTLGTMFGRYNRAVAARHLTAATPDDPQEPEPVERGGAGASPGGGVRSAGAGVSPDGDARSAGADASPDGDAWSTGRTASGVDDGWAVIGGCRPR
ncbi:MarR family winged helix-turn-helix transcriptional regulator [Streptantibioticus silvisoli]|uniref:MarR family winged helix-turn-helix transcriptional regulator n=1 Tax=Streptantibioticus silvisoli TaxID=2705255 RepID=A0ABT6W3B9_9ACTN|nr:MarR family winged helix-turn-helix transcriptional regulator [Streptantibioticus silvisoli]MDI5965242.1 MarR family winged helix-turn-helix transcriptional regulator [Streptantibioticus silvisoli]